MQYVGALFSRHKVFPLFIRLWRVLFKSLDDATRSSLGNPHNMATITETLVFVNISETTHGTHQNNFGEKQKYAA